MNNLDRSINNEFLIVSKSLLPYLNVDKQKSVAVFIKVMELIYTVNLFSNESAVRNMSRSQETGWERDFLHDLRTNLPNDKAYFIDAILKLTEAKELLLSRSEGPNLSEAPDYHLHPEDSGILNTDPFPIDEPSKNASTNGNNISSNERPNTPSPEQFINSLSSLLDPNQTQLLKVLSSILKS